MDIFDAGKMLSFDLETTGLDITTARIVTAALISINGGAVDRWEALANPGVPIPEEASKVHGITTEKAIAEGRPMEEVLDEVITRIRAGWAAGQTLIVYNAPYDLSILHQLEPSFTIDGPVFDPLLYDRMKEPFRRGGRRLGQLCEIYGLDLTHAHSAGDDALAAARIAWKMSRKYADLQTLPLDELMEEQAVAYARIQEEYREYLIKKGRDAQNIDYGWPLSTRV